MSSESRTRVRVCAFRAYEIPMTKDQCNQMCLQLPVQFGYQCRGFYFELYEKPDAYQARCELHKEEASCAKPYGACELYNATFTKKDLISTKEAPSIFGAQETDIGER